MRVTAPATLAARQELTALAANLHRRPGMSPDVRFALREAMMRLSCLIEVAEHAPAHDGAAQALAAVRGAAANDARDLILNVMRQHAGSVAA